MNPTKFSFKNEAVPLMVIALTIFFTVYFYSSWPDMVASHWNLNGEVDGYSSKICVAWIFPAIISLIYILFLALPYVDPKRKNYENFSEFYNLFKSLLITVFF
jgi:uncharacterized membrane protein